MAVETTRPDVTVHDGSNTLTGAPTRHEALSDDSDDSYITTVDGTLFCVVTLPVPSIPSGAVVKDIRVRHRRLNVGTGSQPTGLLNLRRDQGLPTSELLISHTEQIAQSSTITTVATPWVPISGVPQNLRLSFRRESGNRQIRWFELYVDVRYVAKPEVVVEPIGT